MKNQIQNIFEKLYIKNSRGQWFRKTRVKQRFEFNIFYLILVYTHNTFYELSFIQMLETPR